MAGSVHTNMSAMVALQNLNRTNREMQDVQTRISTGMKVSNAKENGAVYNIAQQLRSEHSAYDAVATSLNRASSIADVALSAGEQISDIFMQMRQKAVAASDTSSSAVSRAAYNQEFLALRDQVNQIIVSAVFDGGNMLNGKDDPVVPTLTEAYTFLGNATGTLTLDLPVTDFRLLTTTTPPVDPAVPFAADQVQLEITSNINTPEDAADVRERIAASLIFVNSELGRMGAAAKRVESHNIFVTKLQDSIKGGIGNLVDADLAVESARLQAVQVKQQLGTQSLSIANQSPQSLLSLFRN
jgi:flagellin